MYIHSIGACVGRDGSGSHYITEVKKKNNQLHWVNWTDNNMSAVWVHDQILYDTPKPTGTCIWQIGNLVIQTFKGARASPEAELITLTETNLSGQSRSCWGDKL